MPTGKFTQVPSGNIKPTLNAGRFSAPFEVKATFSSATASDLPYCEYRQYVQGRFKFNGSDLVHKLCGSIVLNPQAYQEDGCPPDGCTAYGYRACFAKNPNYQYTNSYQPKIADGPNFWMKDDPGFSNPSSPGKYEIDLAFIGQLIDTRHPGVALASASWTVKGTHTVTGSEAAAPVAAHQTATTAVVGGADLRSITAQCRTSDGHWDVVVGLVRLPNLAELSTDHFQIRFVDGNGKEIAPRESHQGALIEVGDSLKATASAFYRFPKSGPRPAHAEVKVGNLIYKSEILDR